MFKSPIEFYQSHYGNHGDIDMIFAASLATSEAIFAIENGDKELARQNGGLLTAKNSSIYGTLESLISS